MGNAFENAATYESKTDLVCGENHTCTSAVAVPTPFHPVIRHRGSPMRPYVRVRVRARVRVCVRVCGVGVFTLASVASLCVPMATVGQARRS